MMRKSVRDLQTVAALGGKRRKRTVAGAYLEMWTLAMQKERLLKERKAAAGRIADIDKKIREMERQSEILLDGTGETEGAVATKVQGSLSRAVEKDRAGTPFLCERELAY